MTKQIATSSESGANAAANNDHGIELFELLLKNIQSQLTSFKAEDTILIGNCPQNVTEEEIRKFFCGFATIVKLQKVAFKTLTTNVYIAKFDSAESASRSKVLNTLSLNGKKILLLQPDDHFFNKKNIVELNGLQEHSEEVIYDHMSTFGNVSFVLKTTTVTYIVFDELSAAESSCRCDYLDKYPVTIRSVLDSSSTGASGSNTSIEICILEQIDQDSSLLAEEEEGQISNFMQLLDMENLDEYLEQDEKEKSSTSDKPLLEVGNEEIIVTGDEAAQSEGEADVAAIEKQALRQTKSAETVLVDNRTKNILKLSDNVLRLTDLPQLNVRIQKISRKTKRKADKKLHSSKHKKSEKSTEYSVSKGQTENLSHRESEKEESEMCSKVEKKDQMADKRKIKEEKYSGKEELNSGVKTGKDTLKTNHIKHYSVHRKEKEDVQKTCVESASYEIQNKTEREKSANKPNEDEHGLEPNIAEIEQQQMEKQEERRTEHQNRESEVFLSSVISEEKEDKSTVLPNKKSVFVLLTKLNPKQIQEMSFIRKNRSKNPSTYRRPGPAKGALREKSVTKKSIKATKRSLSNEDVEPLLSSENNESFETETADLNAKSLESISAQKPKKAKLENRSENDDFEHARSDDTSQETLTELSQIQGDVEFKGNGKTKYEQQQFFEQLSLPDSTSETTNKIGSVPVFSNTVEIDQNKSLVDLESDDEQPLVMDISFDMTEETVDQKPPEEKCSDRIQVALDSKSTALLKGKIHDNHFLYLDRLPKVAVKIKQLTDSDYKVSRMKEHSKSSSGHQEKHQPKKVSFDSSTIRRKEDKLEKPRKTNLDKIDSKFLPAGSKLKLKIKSKTEINHKKHLPVPDLPIELKTHLNTSFKIPKKNSNVNTQSIDRNASELNCLHKDQDLREQQRKRFQKDRRPRDGPGGNDRKQYRPETSSVRQAREPSPVLDVFDPSFDDHSPSPQRIPPTPPPATDTSTPLQGTQRKENQRPAVNIRGNNKPSFKDIWNIPENKAEVWSQPPWNSSAGSATIDSGNKWDSKTVQTCREQKVNTRLNLAQKSRSPQQSRNTIDSGESWSPGGAQKSERPQPSQTIDSGDSWFPNNNKRDPQIRTDSKQKQHPEPQLRGTTNKSPHPNQNINTISCGNMWDIDAVSSSARTLPSSEGNVHKNPLLSGENWDQRSQNRISMDLKPDRRRRSRSRSPRQTRDLSPRQQSLDRRTNRQLDRNVPPTRRRQSRSRSPDRRLGNANRSFSEVSAKNSLLTGENWDEEIIPLRSRSPPKLRESDNRRYATDRAPVHDRDSWRKTGTDRSSVHQNENRRWSRDRSPNSRIENRSKSPNGRHQIPRRPPIRRRPSDEDRSPSYQRTLDYWKAVEDAEDEMSGRCEQNYEERTLDIIDRMQRKIHSATNTKSGYQSMDEAQYSPSGAFDALSSDEECDFINPRVQKKTDSMKTIDSSNELPSLSLAGSSPISDTPDFGASFKYANESQIKLNATNNAPMCQSPTSEDDKKNVLEHLKQRAERLKKLEEMKLARQKLLSQIKQHRPLTYPEFESSMQIHNELSEKANDERPKNTEQVLSLPNTKFGKASVNIALHSDTLANKSVQSAVGVPFLKIPSPPVCPLLPFIITQPAPAIPSAGPPPPPPDEIRPPEPVGFVNTKVLPPINVWNPPPRPFAPMPLIDVSQPPPNVRNPLLSTMPAKHYNLDNVESLKERSSTFLNHSFKHQPSPSNIVDQIRRSQSMRGPNFRPVPETNPFQRQLSEENDRFNPERRMPSEPNNQQRHRDPRQYQQNRFETNRHFMEQQQQQQQQQQPQQHRDPRQNREGNVYRAGQLGDNMNSSNPRSNFDNSSGNTFSINNPRNNFNNNPRNNFANNNSNNPRSSIGNNNPWGNFRNNFTNNNPRNNNPDDFFNDNSSGNNNNMNFEIDCMDDISSDCSGNNFNNNPRNNFNKNPRNNFNNNPRNNFNNNPRNNYNSHPGNNFNNGSNNFNNNNADNNFNSNNSADNFDNDYSGNNFNCPGNYFQNNQGGPGVRGRFNNNQQRFNFQEQTRNQRFTNNNSNHPRQQQQQIFLQQQELIDEGCFDMNELDPNDEDDANDWDDLMQ